LSFHEANIVKRHKQTLQNKIENNQLGDKHPILKGETITDLWSTPTHDKLWVKKFKAFARGDAKFTKGASFTKVKAIITPHEGQSYNPKASTHKQILSQVIKEEVREIETSRAGEQL